MPAYWIARSVIPDFTDAAQSAMGRYTEVFRALQQEYPYQTLSRAVEAHVLEGEPRPGMFFIHQFESIDSALGLYNSPQYREVHPLRKKFSQTDLMLLDGVDAWPHEQR